MNNVFYDSLTTNSSTENKLSVNRLFIYAHLYCSRKIRIRTVIMLNIRIRISGCAITTSTFTSISKDVKNVPADKYPFFIGSHIFQSLLLISLVPCGPWMSSETSVHRMARPQHCFFPAQLSLDLIAPTKNPLD